MATEDSEAIVRRFEAPPGPEGIKRLIGMYRHAFPEIHFRTGEMISSGNTVAHRSSFVLKC